eukprot:Gb_12590 [translate_table: standard]
MEDSSWESEKSEPVLAPHIHGMLWEMDELRPSIKRTFLRTANYSAQIRMDDTFWEWEVEYNVSQLWHPDQNGRNLLGMGMPMFYGITPLASSPGMVTECQEATTIIDQTTPEVTVVQALDTSTVERKKVRVTGQDPASDIFMQQDTSRAGVVEQKDTTIETTGAELIPYKLLQLKWEDRIQVFREGKGSREGSKHRNALGLGSSNGSQGEDSIYSSFPGSCRKVCNKAEEGELIEDLDKAQVELKVIKEQMAGRQCCQREELQQLRPTNGTLIRLLQ